MKIGGNIEAIIQISTTIQNEIGEDVDDWKVATEAFLGWLDLSSGDSPSVNWNAKIQESTHVFVCDYFPLIYKQEEAEDVELTPENSRMIVDGKPYEVMVYDNPMHMNQQLEIYLKYVGG